MAVVRGVPRWGAGGPPGRAPHTVPGAVPLAGCALPASCVLLLGQESAGLTPEAVEACRAVLHITQHGSTRSINAGAAGAIALHAWAAQHLGPTGPPR